MKNRFKAWEIALCVGLACAFTVSALGARTNLEDKLIRLHVVGASDSDADQELKLLVRDETLSLLAEPLKGVADVGEAEEVIRGNLPALEAGLRTFLEAQGSTQTAEVSLRTEPFPTREYSTFALPAGPYTALRVVLGEGEGRNWWCVVFPPLCAEAAIKRLPEQAKSAGLTEDDVALITKADEGYAVKFKLAEWLGSIKNRFMKKR